MDGFEFLVPIGVELQTFQPAASRYIDYPISAYILSLRIYEND